MSVEDLEKKIMNLRETLTWMDLVMSNVNECIMVLDNEWRIVFANSYLADILGQNRILLLGKNAWEILPFLESKVKLKSKFLPLKSVSKLDGVYDLSVQPLHLKLLFHGKYVGYLKQAVCIFSDVSVELKAEKAIISLHEEIATLNTKLKAKRKH